MRNSITGLSLAIVLLAGFGLQAREISPEFLRKVVTLGIQQKFIKQSYRDGDAFCIGKFIYDRMSDDNRQLLFLCGDMVAQKVLKTPLNPTSTQEEREKAVLEFINSIGFCLDGETKFYPAKMEDMAIQTCLK